MGSYLVDRYLRLPDGTFPHMGVSDGDVNPFVILCGNPERVERIQERFDESVSVGRKRGYIVYSGTYRGVPITVASSGLGCPSVAVAVEELAAVGGKTFIRAGSCASIQPDAQIGHAIIATAAVRDEGTSGYYAPDNYPAVATQEVVQALRNIAKEHDMPHHIGIVRSTDSFYQGERKEEIIDRWRRHSVLAFDMETSTLFTVASQLGFRSGSILVPGSNLIRGLSTYQGHSKEKYEHGINQMITISLNAILRLHDQKD